jgi:hypothetical protein
VKRRSEEEEMMGDDGRSEDEEMKNEKTSRKGDGKGAGAVLLYISARDVSDEIT